MARALYIHWPFCLKKCPYCDFNSHVRDGVDVDLWRGALLADLRHEAEIAGGERLESVFFGGGTPSLMPPELVATLLGESERLWGFAPEIEITLEANPSSVEAARFAALAAAGVNRVSLGLQALDDEALHFLGRLHNVAESLAALDVAQAHFARVSFDLIYARPGHRPEAWQAELARALGFGTGHLSLYQLTIEPGTRFATMVRQGQFTPLDDDAAADLFTLTRNLTAAAGLPAYEISNHARPGEICVPQREARGVAGCAPAVTSSATAARGSEVVTRPVPTRTASAPAAAYSIRSSGPRTPDSAIFTTSLGSPGAICSKRDRSTRNVRKSRALTPITRAPASSARVASSSV